MTGQTSSQRLLETGRKDRAETTFPDVTSGGNTNFEVQ